MRVTECPDAFSPEKISKCIKMGSVWERWGRNCRTPLSSRDFRVASLKYFIKKSRRDISLTRDNSTCGFTNIRDNLLTADNRLTWDNLLTADNRLIWDNLLTADNRLIWDKWLICYVCYNWCTWRLIPDNSLNQTTLIADKWLIKITNFSK